MEEERFDLLAEKYLEGTLTAEERIELNDLLARDRGLRGKLVERLTQEAAINMLCRAEAHPAESTRPSGATHRLPRRRYPRLRTPRWPAALVAAAVLVGLSTLVALFAGRSRGGDPGTGTARRPVEDVARPERQTPPVEPKRAEVPRPPERPDAGPSREEDAARLRAEKERIEEEMRRAAEEARRRREEPPPEAPKPPPEPPRQETRAAVARIERLEGQAFIVSNTERTAARAEREILSGQGLATAGDASRAVLGFPDGTLVELGPETEVRELVDQEQGRRLVLATGVVTATVARQPRNRPMVFATPQGEATVLGTTLRLAVDAAATRLEVEEGKVRLTRLSDSKSVEVSGGYYAVAAAGVELSAKPLDSVLFAERFDDLPLDEWPSGWRMNKEESRRHLAVSRSKADARNRVLAPTAKGLGGATQTAGIPCAIQTDAYAAEMRMRFATNKFSRTGFGLPGELKAIYDGESGSARVQRDTTEGIVELSAQPLSLEAGPWHVWRVEVRGTRLTLLADKRPIISIETEFLRQEKKGISLVSKSAEPVEFDDVRLLRLAR